MAEQHESHDFEAIVAFVDGELAGPELEAMARQVMGCRACSVLVDDLRSLALAHRDLATPVRPRDLRLTRADAERLERLGPEPLVATARLGTEMLATPSTHVHHDPERIAAAVGGTLEPAERRLIDAWLAECSTCAELHADLLAIVSAERALPTPSRPRDFQLTPADAHRLRPGGWRAVLAAVGSSRDAFSKPLAVGLTTLGLAGLLVGTAPSLGMGGSATVLSTVGAAIVDTTKSGEPGAQSESYGDGSVFGGQDAAPSAAASAAPAPAASAAAAAAAPSAAPSADSESVPNVAAPIRESDGPREGTEPPAATEAPEAPADTTLAARDAGERLAADEGPPTLIVVSLILLLAGVGLFVVRWGASRLRGA